MVSAKELKAITAGKGGKKGQEAIPYMKMYKDPSMHAVLLLAIGGFAGVFIFEYFGPTFLNKVMGVQLASTGFLTALPHALSMALKFLIGPIFDVSTFISERNRLLMLAFLTQGVTAICLFTISQNPGEMLTKVAYCGAGAFSGLISVSGMKITQMVFFSADVKWSACFANIFATTCLTRDEVARQHIDFVLVCVTICRCATAIVFPVIIAVVCPHNTMDEWSTLFLGTSVFRRYKHHSTYPGQRRTSDMDEVVISFNSEHYANSLNLAV
ncbi:hypothetical protein KIN20_002909 [Parelaphostrongylus tenuis]|uniref:Uncharacterized protein n=1 Tax=Parelaphostrongylus tenuis TaxID=148309 RepID=A0AAD5MP57_PARTN|nr:hypothetical protein KIN20_002909 [Parelaphostrongylus tenuis]